MFHEPTWTPTGALTPESREVLNAIDLHFHDLRHEAGCRWIEAGWPLHHVRKMLGYANLSQTSTYLHASEEGLAESGLLATTPQKIRRKTCYTDTSTDTRP